ncbi:hypothetical protein [Labrys sp. ZIDIC5]|uniref:phage late control D family protein n=1 Tax=Labrys sedimenti TaxID=3106036 RepID=UPI002ACA7BE8|nr:hypothetical protein [Labrys sp. ZIDIC5]MDZ5448963.1 hypothetical protein [Labrys sp. ZIDIC5]
MTYRTPRANLVVNGQPMRCEEINVDQSRDGKSDTFSARAPLWHLPEGLDADWWSSATDIKVQVYVDIGQGAVKLFDGVVDDVEHDFDSGVLNLNGRDKAAKLLDKKSSAKFHNKKPHEIVQQLAKESGLEADVDDVADRAGKIYQIDYAAIQHRISDWSSIQDLADKHGRVAYISGGKVYFKKPDEQLPVLKVTYRPPTPDGPADSNAVKLSVKRSVTLGRPIKHKVKSWNHRKAESEDGEYTEPGDGDELVWQHHYPGLSRDQADRRAKDQCDKTTKHEVGPTVTMPGDPTVTPRFMLEISGTGTAYDHQYEIKSLKHRLKQGEPYTMSVNCKAKSKKRGKSKG